VKKCQLVVPLVLPEGCGTFILLGNTTLKLKPTGQFATSETIRPTIQCRTLLGLKLQLSRCEHLTPHTAHLTPHTAHLTPHTSHFTPHASHRTSHTAQLTPHTSHRTPHTAHLTPHTSHRTPHTSHLTPHASTSHLTPYMFTTSSDVNISDVTQSSLEIHVNWSFM
jgi:hypothetical protein